MATPPGLRTVKRPATSVLRPVMSTPMMRRPVGDQKGIDVCPVNLPKA
jgi:hypothetical protein